MADETHRIDADDRARLTPTALKASTRIARAWDLDNFEAAALFALPTTDPPAIRSEDWIGSLNEEQFKRMSAIIGIYGALKRLFADDMAERWPSLENAAPPFLGRTVIQAMIEDGLPTFIETLRHVEAMAAGF